jgi:hypothetical protein
MSKDKGWVEQTTDPIPPEWREKILFPNEEEQLKDSLKEQEVIKDRELMQMALDAMESFESGTNGLYKGEFAEERKALRERLAQPTCQENRHVVNSATTKGVFNG